MEQVNTNDITVIDLELEKHDVPPQIDAAHENATTKLVEEEPVTTHVISDVDSLNIYSSELTSSQIREDVESTISEVDDTVDKTDTSDNNQQSTKKQNVQHDEYIIAMRTKHMIDKLTADFSNNGVVTRDVLNYYGAVYKNLDAAFVTKFNSNTYFDEYHQMINEAYDVHSKKLNNLYMIYEKNKCDEYVTEIRDTIYQDQNLKKIQEEWCNNIQGSYDAYKIYKESILTKINDFVNLMKVSNDGKKYIVNLVNPILENIESKCNKIVRMNMEYIVNCANYTKKFSEEIDECIENIDLSGFDDDQDDVWNDVCETLESMYEQYMSTYILYNIDKCSPPKKLRESYETEIKILYHNKWINEMEQIKINKNREYLKELFESNHNFIESCNIRVNKLSFDDLMRVSEYDDLSMVKSEFLLIKQIIERCKVDIFYIGKIYMILSKTTRSGKEHHVYENNIMVNYVKQLRLNNGIYTKENIPPFLVLNESVIDKLFTAVNICNNKLYVMTPRNLEMFSKFTELVNGLRVKEEVETYFDFDMADLDHALTLM